MLVTPVKTKIFVLMMEVFRGFVKKGSTVYCNVGYCIVPLSNLMPSFSNCKFSRILCLVYTHSV